MVGALQDEDPASGARQVRGGGQAVVSRADDDVVVRSNCDAHRSCAHPLKGLRSTDTAAVIPGQRRMRATNGVESFIEARTALEWSSSG